MIWTLPKFQSLKPSIVINWINVLVNYYLTDNVRTLHCAINYGPVHSEDEIVNVFHILKTFKIEGLGMKGMNF